VQCERVNVWCVVSTHAPQNVREKVACVLCVKSDATESARAAASAMVFDSGSQCALRRAGEGETRWPWPSFAATACERDPRPPVLFLFEEHLKMWWQACLRGNERTACYLCGYSTNRLNTRETLKVCVSGWRRGNAMGCSTSPCTRQFTSTARPQIHEKSGPRTIFPERTSTVQLASKLDVDSVYSLIPASKRYAFSPL
jgi:hypothetical protein